MEVNQVSRLSVAIQDFREARRQANLQSMMARLTGRSDMLLSFEEVRGNMGLAEANPRYLDEIPLDAIVGSVGRYLDFNRQFLPLTDSDQDRWARVKIAQEEIGLPPIEVYKIGDAYFVMDGNHRVSIAHQFEAKTIEAWVTEFRTSVSLSPDDEIQDVILKAEQAEMLRDTGLDKIRPNADFSVTLCGRSKEISEHIGVHQYYLGLEKKREIQKEEAVASWVDNVYMPTIEVIRQYGILRDFPERTETDLYLWLKKHQAELASNLNWEVEPDKAATDLVKRFSARPARVLSQIWANILDYLTPDPLESGPPAGEWRVNMVPRRDDKMFSAILVSLSGSEKNWVAFEQALLVAQREEAVLRGLHVARTEEMRAGKQVDEIRDQFMWRCEEVGVRGEFSVEVGDVARSIVQRSTWSDLVILHLFHPPGDRPLSRLRSGVRTILNRCPRPVLAVPRMANKLERTLVAYDGSPKADEALFLASYLNCCWNTELIVVGSTDQGDEAQNRTLDKARAYLHEHDQKIQFVWQKGPAGDMILQTAKDYEVDLLLMGGYGKPAWVSAMMGSTVDKVLREFKGPTLVCR